MTREEAIEVCKRVRLMFYPLSDKVSDAMMVAIEALKRPERKKGYWIGRPIAGYATVRCSVCTELFFENQGKWNFCPNCGAEMERER